MSDLVEPMTGRPVIAHVIRSLEIGGLENGVVNLVNATAGDFRHVIVCLSTDGALRERLRPDVDVYTIGKQPGIDPRAFGRLVALLRRLRPAAVHSRNWAAFDAIPAARLAGVPVVIHGEHGRDIRDPEGRNPRRNRLRRAMSPLVSRFVTVSHDLRNWLVEIVRIPPKKIQTIHNGVDVDRFGHADRSEARARLQLGSDALAIGTVGRLDPVKDYATLVQAFARIAPTHPTAALLLVGDGPCREELAGLVSRLQLSGRVHLLGERHDVPGILAALDVFVLSSIAEGIANTILEAMATGLPVIATRVGGNPELVDDGVTGQLVPSRSATDLAAAIARYLDDPHCRSLHGAASRDRVVSHFSLGRMSVEYSHLYAALVGRLGAPGSCVASSG